MPVPPTDVMAVPGMPPQGTLTVTWRDPEGGFSGLLVTLEGPGPARKNFTVDRYEETLDCTGLDPGLPYNVTVSTLNDREAPVSAPTVTGVTGNHR